MKANSPRRHRMFEIAAGLFLFGASMCSSLALAVVLAFPFGWLWNWVAVPVLRVASITYWQSLGLLLLWIILRVVSRGIIVSAEMRDAE